MMKIKQLSIACLLVLSLSAEAQSQHIRDIFKQMPDTIAPYLSENNRLDMLDFIDSKMKPIVTNRLGSKVLLKNLTDNYLCLLSDSGAFQTEIRLLPQTKVNGGDNFILCLVQTYGDCVKESAVTFYTLSWDMLSKMEVADYGVHLFHHPDTMDISCYEDLMEKYKGTQFVSASLSSKEDALILQVHIPSVIADDKKNVSAISGSKVLYWNGKMFK